MAASQSGIRDYALGNSPHEQGRLKLQAAIVGRWTELFLRSAGLDRGMSVLDLGCGMGDVSILAAELVGPSGRVTGVDRDSVVIEKARERVIQLRHECAIDFVQSEWLHFVAEREFDAVIGRYFLLYQPDPVLAIKHAMNQVRSGGILCFHEMDFGNPIRSYPEKTLFGRMYELIGETIRRAGAQPDFGLHLTTSFLQAGLPWPELKAEVPLGGQAGSYIYGWITETLRSLLPRIEQFGLCTSEELDLPTLANRMEAEAVAFQSQLIGPIQFGAWAKNSSSF